MFEILEHKGETAIRASGKTIEQAFEEAGKALFSVMVSLDSVEEKKEINFEVSGTKLDELFVNFLNELIFQSGINEMFFSSFKLEKIEKNENFFLKGKAFGEKINEEKHDLGVEVKAASLSGLKVDEKENTVQCVLDV